MTTNADIIRIVSIRSNLDKAIESKKVAVNLDKAIESKKVAVLRCTGCLEEENVNLHRVMNHVWLVG